MSIAAGLLRECRGRRLLREWEECEKRLLHCNRLLVSWKEKESLVPKNSISFQDKDDAEARRDVMYSCKGWEDMHLRELIKSKMGKKREHWLWEPCSKNVAKHISRNGGQIFADVKIEQSAWPMRMVRDRDMMPQFLWRGCTVEYWFPSSTHYSLIRNKCQFRKKRLVET